jgi:bacterioferritin
VGHPVAYGARPEVVAVQGNPEVIELLNEVLTGELTSINQYFVDAKMLGNWGYDRLAERYRKESIDEMKDADELIERILYLEGVPNLQRLFPVKVGETPLEKLTLALDNEREAIDRLNRGVALCVSVGDNGSRDLLAGILGGEEDHADWLETQLGLVAQLGETNYLAQQLRD